MAKCFLVETHFEEKEQKVLKANAKLRVTLQFSQCCSLYKNMKDWQIIKS